MKTNFSTDLETNFRFSNRMKLKVFQPYTTLREEIICGRNFYAKKNSKLINRKNLFRKNFQMMPCFNSMAYRYFLLKNKTHFAMFQVNFLSL